MKNGDKVICVNSHGVKGIVFGETYTVFDTVDGDVYLKEVSGQYIMSRFVLDNFDGRIDKLKKEIAAVEAERNKAIYGQVERDVQEALAAFKAYGADVKETRHNGDVVDVTIRLRA